MNVPIEPERRDYDRISAKLYAELTTGELYTISAKTIDISVNSVLLECSTTLPAGTACELKFVLHGKDKAPISIDIPGTVIRSDDSRMAVEFQEVEPDRYQQLRNLVLLAAAMESSDQQDSKPTNN